MAPHTRDLALWALILSAASGCRFDYDELPTNATEVGGTANGNSGGNSTSRGTTMGGSSSGGTAVAGGSSSGSLASGGTFGGSSTTGGTSGTISSTGGTLGGGMPSGGTATGGVATGGAATGGAATGGAATGGAATGGAATGGAATGGAATGGVATGGVATGGVATGGAATGGVATGGVATGGAATGGAATGGAATGGAATGGAATGGAATGGTGACTPTNGGVEICDGTDNDCASGPDNGVACPGGCRGIAYNGNGYQFCEAGLDWDTALANCTQQGMHLVKVDNAAENDFIATTAFPYGAAFLWLGGDDRAVANQWVWSDGTSFWTGLASGTATPGMYTNWYPGMPGPGGVSNCLELRDDHTWDNKQCTQGKRYVCELLY